MIFIENSLKTSYSNFEKVLSEQFRKNSALIDQKLTNSKV